MTLIDFDIECARCGTNLRAVDSQEACSLCKCPVAETLDLVLVDPADLRVSGDLACTGCAYNLRTLHANSVCPECGKSIAPSLSPDPLRRAGRDWLNAMRRGLSLLLVVTLVYWLLEFAGCLNYPLMLVSWNLSGWPRFFAQQCCYVLWCVAIWRATRPEPACRNWAGTGGWRSWARGMAIAQLVGHMVAYVVMVICTWANTGRMDFLPTMAPPIKLGQIIVMVVVWLVVVLMSAASAVLLFAHLRQVALRAGRKAGLTTVLIWLLIFQGILHAIQYGPFYFLMMCQSYSLWPALDAFRSEVQTIWRASYFLLTVLSLILLVLEAIALLRFKGIIKGAAEGRFTAGAGMAFNRPCRSRPVENWAK